MKKGKVLALDYGKKRIGVASGDLEFRIAFPRTVILNKSISAVLKQIGDLCSELEIILIIVGLPLNMDDKNSENKMIREVYLFADTLTKKLNNVKVELFDERLSSFEAEKLMREAREKSGKKKLENDTYAAQIILQRFFDKLPQ